MPENTLPMSDRNAAARKRRGTVLVFVLGVLTLVALVGVGLLASVRQERGRLTQSRSTVAKPQLMDRVVELVQERLWRDLWQDAAGSQIRYLNANPATVPDDNRERNEPFDAPGPNDRWLASTIPYVIRTAAGGIHALAVNSGVGPNTTEQTIAWPRVTYIGSDLNLYGVAPAGTPIFAWPWRSRYPAFGPITATTQVYGDYPSNVHSLDSYSYDTTGAVPYLANGGGVPVILTEPIYPVPFFPIGFPLPTGNPLIPGSTTNVTILEARTIWNTNALVSAPWRNGNGTPTNPPHRFPYFDTNMDGVPDLYDADGDGVPDSPISLVLPYPVQRPSDPKEVYVVVRIIDNSSMVNVNSASSLTRPGSSGNLFDESSVDLQQRGRRVEEVALNQVVKPHDKGAATGSIDRVSRLMAHRSPVGTPNWRDYYMNNNDADFVRRELIGGAPKNVLPTANAFRPYGPRDEAMLRNRGALCSQSRGSYDKNNAPTAATYDTIEEALRWTSLWSTRWNGTGVNASYDAVGSRWQRFMADANTGNTLVSEAGNPTNDYAAVSPTVFKGWRTLLDEDSPWFLGKNLLTTTSYSSTRMVIPRSFTLPTISTQALWSPSPGPLRLDPGNGGPAVLINIPTLQDVLSGNFSEKIDLNPVFRDTAGNPVEPDQVPSQKADYIARLATALYIADLRLGWRNSPPRTSTSTSQEREDIAWQLAINIIDYADKDDEPTILIGPSSNPRYVGLEAQPFLGKVFCEVQYDYNSSSVSSKTAVELYNPFTYQPLPGVTMATRNPIGMDMTNYALRVTDSTGAGPPSVPLARSPAVYAPWLTYVGPAINNESIGRLIIRNNASIPVNTVAPNVVVDSTTLMPPPAGATFDLVNNGSLSPAPQQTGNFYYKKMELVRRLRLSNGSTFDWVVDSMDLTKSNTGLPVGNNPGDDGFDVPLPPGPGSPPSPPVGGTLSTCFIRTADRGRTVGGGLATCSWRFSIDDCTKFTPNTVNGQSVNPGYPNPSGGPWSPTAGRRTKYGFAASITDYPCLGSSTENAVGTDYESFQWFFRNTGYVGNNAIPPAPSPSWQFAAPFDSVADLSRVIAIGTLGTTTKKSLPTILKDNGIFESASAGNPRRDPAMGRIDFGDSASVTPTGSLPTANTAQNAGRLFDLFTASSLSNDGIDNDGDGNADESGEAQKVYYRSAGNINVNTAPASVLRAVPYMFWDDNANTNDWDMAAAVVAFRDRRPARSGFLPPQYAPASTSTTSNRFASIGELAQLGLNVNNPFAIRRFAKDGVDLLPHDTNTNFFSPDFDAERASDRADIVADDLRERDILLARFSNILTTRSDTFTVYIALLDENGKYVARTQFTLDRSPCALQDQGAVTGRKLLPNVIGRVDTDYYNDLQ